MQREMATCERYEVNMQAANFGECVCGAAKALHTAAALAKSDEKGKANAQVDGETLRRQKFVQKEFAPCRKYVVNMQSANFGECTRDSSCLRLFPSHITLWRSSHCLAMHSIAPRHMWSYQS